MIAAACSGTSWPDAVLLAVLFVCLAAVAVAFIRSDRFR